MKLNIISKTLIVFFSLLMIGVPVLAQDGQPVDTDGDNIVIDTQQASDTIVQITESTAEGISAIISSFLNRLYNITSNQYVQVIMVILGAVFLVAGWRIYNWIIILAGALVGATIALAAVGSVGATIEIIAFVIGAVIGGILGYYVYYGAVFVIGAYIGIVFATLVAQSLELLPISPLILFVVAIVGGLIMLGLSFELLVVLASVLGAQLIVMGLGLSPSAIWLGVFILVGIFLQISLTRRSGYSVRRRPSRKLLG
ncbi:MAG: hypothetical protein Phog2KO_23200 [Phototrophicaceae bacterium]